MFVVRQTTVAPAVPAVPASCEQAFRAYAQDVARWAHNLGRADIDVDDVVQEVFFVVSRRLAAFRPDAPFTSWLFEVTRRIVANHRRRQRWRFGRSDSQEVLAKVPSQLRDPAAELERAQLVEHFYAALDRLPEKYRTVIVLYEIEGLSTRAIAELRHLKLGTVKVQLSRARARLVTQYQRLVRREKS